VEFIKEIFRVLSPKCHIGEEIVKQCIKAIEYSFEIMEMDSNEKYLKKLNTFTSEVCIGYFLKSKNDPCLL
jgi:hypothetical protein